MIALLQRVTEASVAVDGECIANIQQGLLVFLAVEKGDTEIQADRLVERILHYRIFADADDKMNLNVMDISGGLLLVPQFTLAADTRKGNRPGFSSAAAASESQHLFSYCTTQISCLYQNIQTGQFAADMQVSLVNNGPVTFWLQVNA